MKKSLLVRLAFNPFLHGTAHTQNPGFGSLVSVTRSTTKQKEGPSVLQSEPSEPKTKLDRNFNSAKSFVNF